jgi:hypothetical protein
MDEHEKQYAERQKGHILYESIYLKCPEWVNS